jgi:hypothetical protein
MVPKNMKRLVLAVGLALLLPGAAGAAGFGAAGDSFWGRLADPVEAFARFWDGLTSVWTGGGSVDPNGGTSGAQSGGDGGGSIDPNGG